MSIFVIQLQHFINYILTNNSKMYDRIEWYLEKAGIKYHFVDAEEEVELTKKFNIRKAPTLVVPTKEGNKVYENASNIKGFVEGIN